jgi:alkaline phosphatase
MRRSLCLALVFLFNAVGYALPTGSVIFLHPDGTSHGSWMATRFVTVGPAGKLHWDRLPQIALYDGRLANSLSASSNGGATTHAWGVRAERVSFGFTEPDARALSGFAGPLMIEAQAAGKAVGIVQTGAHYEPGSAVFLTSSGHRDDHAAISLGVLASGAQVLLGAGEAWFLPTGTNGRHGPGRRTDGRDLVKEAQAAGYTVLFTRDELFACEPSSQGKYLGLFAHDHTFNDRKEEELRAAALPMYSPDAPTYAEMIAFALRVLAPAPHGFFLVAEEEGTDNFANKNNAAGTLLASQRVDEGIRVAREFVDANPSTLLLVAADSNAGGLTVFGPRASEQFATSPLRPTDSNGAPIDGRDGTGTLPFIALPDEAGRELPFWIGWATTDDTSAGVIVRAAGFNSDRVRGDIDNVGLYRLMYFTLFGREADSGR